MRLFVITVAALTGIWAASSSLEDLSPPIEELTVVNLRDTFNEVHNGHAHEALDIMEPRGTAVHAVASGKIQKLFLSRAGGNTIYEFDEANIYCYYYAHLDRYAEGLKEGALVRRGDVIGFVGSTGNASPSAPHLHFAVFVLSPAKEWWKGTPVNPYQALVAAIARARK